MRFAHYQAPARARHPATSLKDIQMTRPESPLLLRATLALSFSLWAFAPLAFADEADPATLVAGLREGGHVVYIRHASTETDYADQVTAVPGDCSTQRMLSADGWAEAKALGRAFVRLGIPVGPVLSSEYCRAWQTADLAFGRFDMTPALNFAPSEDYTAEELQLMRSRLEPLLANPPPTGTNTVIVGHDDPFEAATGIYPEPMGVTFVLRPDGKGGYSVLGRIAPDDWPTE
jgi:phosphohistidine phosphatase SixA